MIAGCLGDDEGVDETATEATAYSVDLSTSQTVELSVDVVEGSHALAELVAPDGSVVTTLETEDRATTDVTVEEDGTYEAWIHPDGEATIRVDPV